MLKCSLKKERLNFLGGWVTSKTAMGVEPISTGHLGNLFTNDPDAALDTVSPNVNSFFTSTQAFLHYTIKFLGHCKNDQHLIVIGGSTNTFPQG